VHGRCERLGPPTTSNKDTGVGYVSSKEGDYARAVKLGAERGGETLNNWQLSDEVNVCHARSHVVVNM